MVTMAPSCNSNKVTLARSRPDLTAICFVRTTPVFELESRLSLIPVPKITINKSTKETSLVFFKKSERK